MTADDEKQRPPWYPMQGETARAYWCFRTALENPGRRLADIAASTGLSYSAIRSLSYRWQWSRRIRAWQERTAGLYDDFADEEETEASLWP